MFIASLILGIATVVLSWVPGLGILLGIISLIISIIAMVKRSKNKEIKNGGMAIAGLITSIAGFIISIIITILIWLPILFVAIGVSSEVKNYSSLNSTNNTTFSEYNYKTMTGSDVRTAIKKYYNRSNFIIEVQAQKDGVYLQYGKTNGNGEGKSKYKSTRAASSQSGYTRKTLSSLNSDVLSSSSYTSKLIYGSNSEVIGLSFTRNK